MIGKRKRLDYRWRAFLELAVVVLVAALLDAFAGCDFEMLLLGYVAYAAISARCKLEDMREGRRDD